MTPKRIFVIRNQLDQYLDKHSHWQSGKDANALFRADFYDQALNTLFEVNSKDISLRGKIIEVDMDEKKRPVVEVSENALTLDSATTQTTSAEEAITDDVVSNSNSEENLMDDDVVEEIAFTESDDAVNENNNKNTTLF